jgi:hypothetical protein
VRDLFKLTAEASASHLSSYYNRYMYVRGNPMRLVDPTGHAAVGPAIHDSNDGSPVAMPTYMVGHIQEDYHNLGVAWADLPSDVLAAMAANGVNPVLG